MTELSFAHALSQFGETKVCRNLAQCSRQNYNIQRRNFRHQNKKFLNYIETITRKNFEDQRKAIFPVYMCMIKIYFRLCFIVIEALANAGNLSSNNYIIILYYFHGILKFFFIYLSN